MKSYDLLVIFRLSSSKLGLVLVAAALAACSDFPDSAVTAAPPDAGVTPVSADGIESTQSAFTVKELKNNVPKSILSLTETAMTVSSVYSGSVQVIDLATKIGQVLGFLGTQEDPFDKLSKELNKLGTAITWQESSYVRDQRHATLISAVKSAQQAAKLGERLVLNGGPDWDSKVVVTAAEQQTSFLRYSDTNATKGWLKYINRPEETNGMVYDWRLGLPSLMELIAMRLTVIAAVDPNFRQTQLFQAELKQHITALKKQQGIMLLGIVCGVIQDLKKRRPIGQIDKGDVMLCADIYSGTYEVINLVRPTPTYTWAQQEKETKRAARDAVVARLPLFQLQQLIDILSLYATTDAEVTSKSHAIRSPSNLCLDVQWGNSANGTPVWLWPCDGGSAQQWSYNRQSGEIRNTAYGKCLDVQWANSDVGTLVWIWDCNGTAAQKWSWNSSGVFRNALGTLLEAHSVDIIVTGEELGPGTVPESKRWF